MDTANSFASCHDAPWTMSCAFSRSIICLEIAGVVLGTTTTTGMDRCRPAYATAIPALPPEELMKRCFPSLTARSHTAPMPRSLNDPVGCDASILSQIWRPVIELSGRDSISGVCMCSGIGATVSMCLRAANQADDRSESFVGTASSPSGSQTKARPGIGSTRTGL